MLWAGAMLGTFITAAYATRLFFVAFCGEPKQKPYRKATLPMLVPFAILAVLGAIAGLPDLIAAFTGKNFIVSFLTRTLPELGPPGPDSASAFEHQVLLVALALAGIGTSYVLWLRKPGLLGKAASAPTGSALRSWAKGGFGFDWVYDRLLVRPVLWICRVNRRDVIDLLFLIPARLSEWMLRVGAARPRPAGCGGTWRRRRSVRSSTSRSWCCDDSGFADI